MNTLSKKMVAFYQATCRKLYVTSKMFGEEYAQMLLFVLGVALLIGGLHGVAYAGEFGSSEFEQARISAAVCLFFRLIEGSFGALVMVVAGLAAIIAAAMGAYRAAMGMLVVAVGAFILRALVSLFFNFDEINAQCTGVGAASE